MFASVSYKTYKNWLSAMPAAKLPLFITGNQNKADYLAKWLELPIEHHKLDLDELQSLNLEAVVEHKVRQAYDLLQQPVLVEDVALTFTAMGRLPGTFIKWFLEELDQEGLCKLADGLEHRGAETRIIYAMYDGKELHMFEGKALGEIADRPRGTNGFGWNPVFIPEGESRTYAEIPPHEVRYNSRAQAIAKLKKHLETHA